MATTTASVVFLENASASSDWKTYPGGLAIFSVLMTGGNVTLEQLGPNGSTALAVTSALAFSTLTQVNLAAGSYRATVAGGATGVWARLDRVP